MRELTNAHTITLDLETRSRIDLRDVGQYRYAEDPSTEITLILWMADDGPVHVIDLTREQAPEQFVEALMTTKVVASWGPFDYVLLNEKLLRPRGMAIAPERFYDISAHALMLTFSRQLKQACQQLRLSEEHEKLSTGTRLIQLFSVSDKDGNFVSPASRPDDWEQFKRYGAQDVVAARACYHALRSIAPWPKTEHQVYVDTLRGNDLGIPIDMTLVDHALTQIELLRVRVMEQFTELTGIDSMHKHRKLVEWCRREGLDIDSVRETVIESYLNSGKEIPESVRQMFGLRAEAPKAAVNKYARIKAYTSADGRVRGMLTYYGAATGRFTGNGPQIHNLARTPSKIPGTKSAWPHDEIVNAVRSGSLVEGIDAHQQLKGVVRAAFRAKDDRAFVVYDFSQIEQRYLAYVSRCDTFLDIYRRASDESTPEDLRDPYVLFATDWLGARTQSDARALRSTAKVVVLGCGYGLGATKFLDYAKTYGLDVTEQRASDLVYGFRAKYSEIPACWEAFHSAVMRALRTCSVVPVLGHIVDATDPRAMSIRLLSGRRIWYREAALETVAEETPHGTRYQREIRYEERDGDTGTTSRRKLYGGKIVENVVQAGCRDLLVHAVRKCSEAGITVVGTVHDEVICEGAVCEMEWTEPKLLDIMRTAPDWCSSLPLDAKGYVGQFYKKE